MNLKNISADAPKDWDKKDIRQRTKQLQKEIAEWQHRLYAEEKKSLLIVLQGMDASGKDGLVRGISRYIPPFAISVSSFKKPSDEEFAHDFLWRIHQEVPKKGQIKIFNRSHYEDILVPSVYGYLPENQIENRYEAINDFEKMLVNEGTEIVKFFLHISKNEQEKQLMERVENPKKHYKHSDGDWSTRENWDSFIKVYEKILTKCDTIPWHIIPTNQRWARTYKACEIVLNKLKEMKPDFPDLVSEKFANS